MLVMQVLFSKISLIDCSATIEIGQIEEKRLRDRQKSARIKLPHKIQVKEGLSLNEQYNTRNAVSSIPNEVFREKRSKKGFEEVQQMPFVHIFLEGSLGRNG